MMLPDIDPMLTMAQLPRAVVRLPLPPANTTTTQADGGCGARSGSPGTAHCGPSQVAGRGSVVT